MSLVIQVEFAPFINKAAPTALVLANPAVPNPIISAHVHIGRKKTATLASAEPLLYDKGTHTTPCELDIAFSQIAGYLKDEGAGADIWIEPASSDAKLRLDIVLLRAGFRPENILTDCRRGTPRGAELPELHGGNARMKIRCNAKTRTEVRVWANEPRVRSEHAPTLLAL